LRGGSISTFLNAGKLTVGNALELNMRNKPIILHNGSLNGFIPIPQLTHIAGSERGDYHSQMDHFTSEKWAYEKFLPYLLQNSVELMDNGPYCMQVGDCHTGIP
jgi:hypothetical protein